MFPSYRNQPLVSIKRGTLVVNGLKDERRYIFHAKLSNAMCRRHFKLFKLGKSKQGLINQIHLKGNEKKKIHKTIIPIPY